MGRQWRIEFAGAFYHILSRGNESGDIFYDDEDRRLFLDTLAEMSERFDLNIYAYVLMGNHYHLLLRTNLPNLSKAMQWFGLTYTRRFNNRHLRSGHLFQGRYKSIIVQNDAYMLRLSCYIHRNPLRAGMVKRLADYRWSSYQYYAYKRKPPYWLSTDMILSQFKNIDNRNRAYREKAQKYSDEESRLWENFRHGIVLGSKNYVSKIRSEYLPDRLNPEMPQQKTIAKEIDSEKLLNRAAKHLDCDLKQFKEAPRISSRKKEDRDILMCLLWKTGRLTNANIGNLFGVTYSSVSHSIRAVTDRLKKDKALRQKINDLYSLFKICDTNMDIKSIFRPSLFWDADKIDIDKHAAYVIARVLDYGDIEDVRKIRELYPDEKIIEAIRTRRGMFPKTGKYWAVKFNIPFSEVPCLKKYYQQKQYL